MSIPDEMKDKPIASPHITIAMPVQEHMAPDLLTALTGLEKPNHFFITTDVIPLDEARNQLIAQFLVNHPRSTHILFWDDDVIPPSDGLKKLWSHEKAIVSGLYFRKAVPYFPEMSMWDAPRKGFVPLLYWEHGGLYKVDGIGMGWCLIRRDVFQKMEYPWFKFGELGEDYTFCMSAKKLGYDIWVDTSVECVHIADRVAITKDHFKLYQESELEKIREY